MKQTGKRLFQYAAIFKKPLLIALLFLAIAVATELAGPFIARQMIDTHILGIEKPWYQTLSATQTNKAVPYEGTYYLRGDNFPEGETKGKEVRILQVGSQFVWVDQAIAFDGVRKLADSSMLTITQGTEKAEYAVKKLGAGQLYTFYKPEFVSLMKLAGLYLVLIFIGAAFTYGQRYLLQSAANRIIQRMRSDVFAQIQRLPINYFDNQPAGKIVSRITNDTESVKDLYIQVLANFFTGTIYIIGIIAALFILDYRLALFTLPVIPLLYVWIVVYRKYASYFNHEIRERIGSINGIINESIQGMPIIQAFRRQKETIEEFEQLNDEYTSYQNKLLSLNSFTSHNLMNVVRNLFFFGLIWYVGGSTLNTLITVGVLYAFVDYLNRMFHPMVGIVNQLPNLERALVSADRVFELLDEQGIDVLDGKADRYLGNVKFEQVRFAYKKGEDVLKDISFEAKQGQTVALVGHTGSGKSSILNLLFRFYDVDEGRITVDGRDVREMPKQMLRQHMGIVLQDPFLFTGTIASNVSLDDPSITRERVEAALREVGAAEMFKSLPHGIDEPVIEKGSTLSAGQRQLISFARALAFDPAILILDEATASIDTETEAVIQAALEVLSKGRTTFIIAHRLSTIKSADQILVLDHGEIVERGNHDELMQQFGRYYQMYQLQAGHRETAADIEGQVLPSS
ncbi:putative multidrug resistance ABC transporter ATP-binding/permease protein YheH [Paenibacillus marchantiophytorum]|uniref:Multidrug resistance ABC transporter ATP-binding/permease protein YheH n=1 Tax=Paenibacillus marchantiophytorum TaxID=1619310 RepID=A0ABQ1ESU6_9BACL|nr:ABC transporter ATP-binding protein [Paenibacillus marchantiophytorum]GFZ85350.1 putative multidrug resistance ABC transporter ATP-binding/permease protein YheH [Paenibacillus marchantiophytorum]